MRQVMLAAITVSAALAGGCANVVPFPDEYAGFAEHSLTQAELPPAPQDKPQAESGLAVQVESYLIKMTPRFETAMGVREILGRNVSKEECVNIVAEARRSSEAILTGAPHLTIFSGKTETWQGDTTGSYVSDYRDLSGVIVPVLAAYFPSRMRFRVGATAEGETALLRNVAALSSETRLVACSAEFSFNGEGSVRLNWFEPVQTTYSIVLDKAFRLKSGKGILAEATVSVDRGFPRLHAALSEREKRAPAQGDCCKAYLLITPTVIRVEKPAQERQAGSAAPSTTP